MIKLGIFFNFDLPYCLSKLMRPKSLGHIKLYLPNPVAFDIFFPRFLAL